MLCIKALLPEHKPLIENLIFFFSRYFSVSHCDGGMFANVTSHSLKVQKITPVRTTKQSLKNQLEIQIFTINVVILILNIL